MSISAIPSAASAAPSATNIQLPSHGHKRGQQLDSVTAPVSSPTSQTPTGSTQNLFSSLLTSLEQVIGIQPQAAAASPAQPNPGGSKIHVTA